VGQEYQLLWANWTAFLHISYYDLSDGAPIQDNIHNGPPSTIRQRAITH